MEVIARRETIVLCSQEDEKQSITSDICSQETSQSQLLYLIDGMKSSDLRSSDLETLCVDWGGEYMNSKLVNTCPLVNFITLLSLHLPALMKSLKCLHTVQKCEEAGNMLADISQKKIDSLRFKISKKLNIEEKKNIIDFFGSEYGMVKLLINTGLSTMRYECELKFQNLSRVFIKVENIITFNKFTVNCQNTIENMITHKVCKHCKRKDVIVTKLK